MQEEGEGMVGEEWEGLECGWEELRGVGVVGLRGVGEGIRRGELWQRESGRL